MPRQAPRLLDVRQRGLDHRPRPTDKGGGTASRRDQDPHCHPLPRGHYRSKLATNSITASKVRNSCSLAFDLRKAR